MPGDKMLSDNDLKKLLDKLKKRIAELSKSCNGIHITDSVLGIKRISPITTGEIIRKNHHNLRITVSLRVRDKSLSVIEKSVRL
jgi:homocysteine S-methyltransferase